MIPLILCLLLLTEATPAPRGVIIRADGSYEIATAEHLDGTIAAEGKLWVWSSMTPPRLLEADSPLPHPQSAPSLLEVSIGGVDGPVEGMSIIAGPVSMWEEVPESILPVWIRGPTGVVVPRNPNEEWRLRVSSPGLASWWIDVPASESAIVVPVEKATPTSLELESSHEISRVRIEAVAIQPSSNRHSVAVLAIVEGQGSTIDLPVLPVGRDLNLLIEADGFVDTPASITIGRPENQIPLNRGGSIHGRVVEKRGEPLGAVKVRVEGWLNAAFPRVFLAEVESLPNGRWKIENIPPGRNLLYFTAPDFVTNSQTVEIRDEQIDFGDIAMVRGVDLSVKVIDDAQIPVADAEFHWKPHGSARTGSDGRALLQNLEPNEPFQAYVEAHGFLGKAVAFEPPLRGTLTVVLSRGVELRSSVVDEAHIPVKDASVVRHIGSRSVRSRVDPNGEFSITVPAEVDVELVVTSPNAREVRVAVAAGFPGEVRDLAPVVLPKGHVVEGTLVSAIDGAPVSGGRVWGFRQEETNHLSAWARGAVVETESDTNGRFRLSGLDHGPFRIIVDHHRFARIERKATLVEDSGLTDLGDIKLIDGTTILVNLTEAPAGALARVDLTGNWLESDMLTAGFTGGKARVERVPPGEHVLSVAVDHQVICTSTVSVSAGQSVVEADCKDRSTRVRGRVFVGNKSAGPGLLIWTRATEHPVPSIIVERPTPGGLMGQTVYGTGPPLVPVAANTDGQFETDSLNPGAWNVRWVPNSGGETEPRSVEVQSVSEQTITLEFGGGRVRGFVIDAQGQKVPGAGVYEDRRRIAAETGADGSFELIGLPPEPLSLYARHGKQRSAVARLSRPDDGEPILLRLGGGNQPQLNVRVVGPDGSPRSGARIFVDLLTTIVSAITTSDGSAPVQLVDDSRPVRVAALAGMNWVFGDGMVNVGDEPATVTLIVQESGILQIDSKSASGSVRMRTLSGLDVTRLATLVGMAAVLAPAEPFIMYGIAPGEYDVTFQGESRRVVIRSGRISKLSF